MGVDLSFKCDKCGREKKDTNNWYLVSFTYFRASLGLPPSIIIRPFAYADAHYSGMILCGEGCLNAVISKKAPDLHKKEGV